MAHSKRDPVVVERAQAAVRPPGYERSDAGLRAFVGFAIALAGCVVIALALMSWLQHEFRALHRSTEVTPSQVFGERPPPPEPRLQAVPAADLALHRAKEEAALSTYGWIDRQNGTVRIPIERAMQLVAEQGLPVAKDTGEKR